MKLHTKLTEKHHEMNEKSAGEVLVVHLAHFRRGVLSFTSSTSSEQRASGLLCSLATSTPITPNTLKCREINIGEGQTHQAHTLNTLQHSTLCCSVTETMSLLFCNYLLCNERSRACDRGGLTQGVACFTLHLPY